MQDRYAFDVGDFGKCGLLRTLAGSGLSIGVIWYAVPNEDHNLDGKHTRYLGESKGNRIQFRACDPDLYDCLQAAFRAGERSIIHLQSSGALPQGTATFDVKIATNARTWRQSWFAGALAAIGRREIVFMDPDNGLIPFPSDRARTVSPKHANLGEVSAAWELGHSLVLYHHIGRHASTEEQLAEWTPRLRQVAPAASLNALLFVRGTRRAYFVLAQPAHVEKVRSRIELLLAGEWRRHFLAAPLS